MTDKAKELAAEIAGKYEFPVYKKMTIVTEGRFKQRAAEILHKLIALPGDGVEPNIFFKMGMQIGLVEALEAVAKEEFERGKEAQAVEAKLQRAVILSSRAYGKNAAMLQALVQCGITAVEVQAAPAAAAVRTEIDGAAYSLIPRAEIEKVGQALLCLTVHYEFTAREASDVGNAAIDIVNSWLKEKK